MINKIPVIGVMGSRENRHDAYALPLGRAIAERGCHLLTGGGGGVMLSAMEGFVSVSPRKGLTIGILPTKAKDDGTFELMPTYPNASVELAILSPLGVFDGSDANQISRNFINIMSSDVIVALPGSRGTRNEVDLAMRFGKPVICFGPASSFEGFSAKAPRSEKLHEVLAFLEQHLQDFTPEKQP